MHVAREQPELASDPADAIALSPTPQTLSKVVIRAADLGTARRLAEILGEAEFPSALAVSLFEIPATSAWLVEAYYQPDAAPNALPDALAGLLGATQAIEIEAVPDANWVALSQAALPPVTAGRFTVHGSHDRGRVAVGPNAIEIDAGEAFGTAHHATTFGCLVALDRLARHHATRAGRRPRRGPGRLDRVLDLGCGSGVLAIAAGRVLPRARILASDIDSEAVRVARANVAANRAGGRVRTLAAGGLRHPALAGPFDLVLANILAGPLIALAGDIRRALAPRGTAVLSGILGEQAAEVVATYRAAGFIVRERRIVNGWATLILERRSAVASLRVSSSRRAA